LYQVSNRVSNPKQWRLFSAGLHGLVIEHRLEPIEAINDHQVKRFKRLYLFLPVTQRNPIFAYTDNIWSGAI